MVDELYYECQVLCGKYTWVGSATNSCYGLIWLGLRWVDKNSQLTSYNMAYEVM